MSYPHITINNVCEMEVSYHPKNKLFKHAIVSSKMAYNFLWTLFNLNTVNLREEVVIMYFNRSNKMIGYITHSIGGISGALVDIRIVLGIALKCGASALIIAHNHPSGNLQPSNADITLCSKVKQACKLLDLQLLDFIIIAAVDGDVSHTPDGYSFADNGQL